MLKLTKLALSVVIFWTVIGLFWTTISFWGGEAFDKVCVEGRLSEEQVKAINELEWEKCPSYREECFAEVNDRVIKRRCSEFSRRIFYLN